MPTLSRPQFGQASRAHYARPYRYEEMRMMATVEFTMDDTYAAVDSMRELLERYEFGLGLIDREALRMADDKLTDAVDSAEFHKPAAKLKQAA